MIGKMLGHNRIVEKLGEGGMGEVYRAFDEHLQRDVAVKVLPEGTLADEAARRRFRKEALALSKLNHPNIETIHDFDTQEGVDFLVMEYVPGQTVAARLAGGPLSEKEIVKLGSQLAEGRAAAHDQGIIHRDLKPGNLMLTPDGRLKILDFGLARLVQPAGDSLATDSSTGAIAGTLPYMAPEQLRGETLDARTDVYAVGNVLYQMASGRQPFQESTAPRLSDAILHRAPVPPRALNPAISPRLEEVICKCLEKDPELRYQSTKELLVDLKRLSLPESMHVLSRAGRRWGTVKLAAAAVLIVAVVAAAGYVAWRRLRPRAGPESGKVMLAVLPVENLSGEADEYFSDGLTEEMIAKLGSLQPQRLGVIARTSVMRYKHTTKGIDQIGRELSVDFILEGSVRREAGRVRVTAQLIQVRDQTHLWAETYERDSSSLFSVQSDVAGRVADSLALELLPAQKDSLGRVPTRNPEAHEAYLKARYYWNMRTAEAFQKSLEYFKQALEHDPDYPLAYAGLADYYNLLPNYNLLQPQEAFPRAKAAAMRALEGDANLAEAQASLAFVEHHYDWDWSKAEQDYKRSIAMNYGYASAHQWYAEYLAEMGRHDEALAEIKRARELDPLSLIIDINVGRLAYYARRYDEAIEALRNSLRIEPNFGWSHTYLAMAYGQKGMWPESNAEYQKISAMNGGAPNIGLVLAAAAMGRKDDARKMFVRIKDGLDAYVIAEGCVALDAKDEAFTWLEKGYWERSFFMVFLKVDPWWDPLRPDPRFQELLRRMNFPP
jgi:serine/threonine-protein kinase